MLRTSRKKLPFGIAQIGKSFRNEITPGNFTFRTREFEQMELEFFCRPGEDLQWFDYWRGFCRDWLLSLNMTAEHLRLRDHAKEELAFYSNATTDFEYKFPFGWGELWGVADRTDYDLRQHMEHSAKPWSTSTRPTARRSCPTASSRRWALTAPCWRSCATHTRSRNSTAATRASCCTCIGAGAL